MRDKKRRENRVLTDLSDATQKIQCHVMAAYPAFGGPQKKQFSVGWNSSTYGSEKEPVFSPCIFKAMEGSHVTPF